MPKIAVLAPMPSASVSSATSAKPGCLTSARTAYRASRRNVTTMRVGGGAAGRGVAPEPRRHKGRVAKLRVAQPFGAARRRHSRPEGLRYDTPPLISQPTPNDSRPLWRLADVILGGFGVRLRRDPGKSRGQVWSRRRG